MVKHLFPAHKGMHRYAEYCLEIKTLNVDFDATNFKAHLSKMRLSYIQIDLPTWPENKACQILGLKQDHRGGVIGDGGG